MISLRSFTRYFVLTFFMPVLLHGQNYGAENSKCYVDLGNISLPASDWTLIIPHRPNTDPQAEGCLFSLGKGSDSTNLVGSNNSLAIFQIALSQKVSGIVGAISPRGCYIAVGRSANGNYFSTRNLSQIPIRIAGQSANVRGLVGPRPINDGRSRLIILRKKNGRVEMLEGRENLLVRRVSLGNINDPALQFGALENMPALLGALNNPTKKNFASGIGQGCILWCGGAMTDEQLNQINRGDDARKVITFERDRGDRYWPGTRTADGKLEEVVAGQHGTILDEPAGSVSTVLPTTPVLGPKLDFDGDGEIYPMDPLTFPAETMKGVTNVVFFGKNDGPLCDIQIQVIDWTSGDVIKDWTTIAKQVAIDSPFHGTLEAVPHRLGWNDLKIRSVLDGVPQPGKRLYTKFSIGLAAHIIGQSNVGTLRTSPARPLSSGTAAYVSYDHLYLDRTGGNQSIVANDGWHQYLDATGIPTGMPSGWGENLIAELLVNQGHLPVGSCVLAVSGSTIDAWINSDGKSNYCEPLVARFTRARIRNILWNQGEGNTGNKPEEYKAKLETLYNLYAKASDESPVPWEWDFGIIPLRNHNGTDGGGPGVWHRMRQCQVEWVTEKNAALTTAGKKPNCYVACWMVDTASGGTSISPANPDFLHHKADMTGQGLIAERIVQHILWRNGLAQYGGLGPAISSIRKVDNHTIEINFTHNGGTGLRAPDMNKSISGFEISIDDGKTWVQPKEEPASMQIVSPTQIKLNVIENLTGPVLVRYGYGAPGTKKIAELVVTDAAHPAFTLPMATGTWTDGTGTTYGVGQKKNGGVTPIPIGWPGQAGDPSPAFNHMQNALYDDRTTPTADLNPRTPAPGFPVSPNVSPSQWKSE